MMDERYVSARKFFMRCGFLYEATLRKHQILRQRNCNTALYSLVNSDWVDGEGKLQRLCGWPKKKKVAATEEVAAPPTKSTSASGAMAAGEKKNKKTKNKNKDKHQKKN